jgi:type II secretory pathway pseudopilin PulG
MLSVVRRPSSRIGHPCACHESRITNEGQSWGFTLVELLVVIFIILLISVVALPTVLPALSHRQVSEAARILQGALVGARDKAIHDGQPSGIRLLPDPNFAPVFSTTLGNPINPYSTLAYNRIVPIGPAPDYSEGFCTPTLANTVTYSGATLTTPAIVTSTYPYALLLIENPVNPQTLAPNPPTSWFWNVRVGDKVQLNNAGPWYTIIGPMFIGPAGGTIGGVTYSNTEMFVNAGPPTSLANLNSSGYVPTLTYPGGTAMPVEYLILVNGQDDNNNGWIDEGFDGVDNDGDTLIDETTCKVSPSWGEWEQEAWLGSVLTNTLSNVPYTIQRRPAPAPNAREIALPTSMVIDATMLFVDKERSRLPVNIQTRYSGVIDIVVNPDGTVLPTTTYSSPSSFGMDQAFYHFWLAERQDLAAVQTTNNNGTITPVPLNTGTPSYYLPIVQPGGAFASNFPGPYLKGEYSVVTLNGRTGQVTTNPNPAFFYDPTLGYTNQPGSSAVYNSVYPFIQAEQGVNGGP